MPKKKTILSIDLEHLPRYAENIARGIVADGEASGAKTARDIRSKLSYIEKISSRAAEFAASEKRVPQAFEWLSDNFYVIRQECSIAAHAIRHAGKLPSSNGKPVILELSELFIKSGSEPLSEARIESFLVNAQKPRFWCEKELYLFSQTLRAAVLDELFELSKRLGEILKAYGGRPEENEFAADLHVTRSREAGIAPPKELLTAVNLAAAEYERLASRFEYNVSALRFLAAVELSKLLEESSAVEQYLMKDPSGVYPKMSEDSRAYYRRELSRAAKKAKISEAEAAAAVLKLSQNGKTSLSNHVGYHILNLPLGRTSKKRLGFFYFTCAAVMTILFSALSAYFLGAIAGALLFLPIWELSKTALDFFMPRLARTRHIPRFEYDGGVPKNARTLCVISALLTGPEDGVRLARIIEEYRLSNRDSGDNLCFGLLCDLPDSPDPERAGDRETIEAAKNAVFALNEKYSGGFFLFTRERTHYPRDKKYMAWERKRGALSELIALLSSEKSGVTVSCGDPSRLRGVKYVITLDADTRLNPGAARRLIASMAHPLNRPVIDERRRVVVSGHGILQPRIAIELEAAGRSFFSRVFAGQGGIDPYGCAASDIYQDVFGAGVFTGKGILDVEAFNKCLSGRIPDNRVLSHDLLEGSYLRAGFADDIELSDGCPHRVSAWFDRAHRWIRGDWQIAPWLFASVPVGGGGREKNPLDALSRYKIFDNLRRSLTPVLALSALIFSIYRHMPGAAVIALFAAAAPVLHFVIGSLVRRGRGIGARYNSAIITGGRGALYQAAFQIMLLPYAAWVSLSAILTALSRMLVTKRNYLLWVTAAESELLPKGSLLWHYGRMWCAPLLGAVSAVTGILPGVCLGVLWLLSPIFARFLSVSAPDRFDIPDSDRAFLLRQAALIWKYFEDMLTPEDNFLPPDNFQEQPAAGIAHRTSSTNMGLALLAALAAIDLSLTPQKDGLALIDKILSSMERLPKWNGHLLNWYDTRRMKPLHPRCVSSVDSGNLAGCLIALREGLAEIGGDFALSLAQRSDNLLSNMKFEPLFDQKRRLFHIGFDLEKNLLTESWYDMMASEARQTSYIAIARGEVPLRHWGRLGRSIVQSEGYRGMASWTGTMFEYFMPHLLLPCYKNSLLYESAAFCLRCQKIRVRGKTPWGISESAFYSFDPAMNYQYKAHGVQRLGLKRGLNRELVVSPYSSFLSLLLDPAGSVRNLRTLRAMGMEGRYGFYEAADFTASRMLGGAFEPIKCYMAHHIGMSILAVDNLLSGNIMQKRFMRDREMAAFKCLLQEKIPVDAVVMRPSGADVPEKPRRAFEDGWREHSTAYDPGFPRCHLLSNGGYTVLSTDGGQSMSVCGEVTLTKFDPVHGDGAGGIQLFILRDDTLYSLAPSKYSASDSAYSCAFDGFTSSFSATFGSFRTRADCRVPDNENAELREVTIESMSASEQRLELLLYFEPVLAMSRDYAAHPAFSKLFLETSLEGGSLVFRRRPRGEQSEIFMCLSCDDHSVRYDSSRENALGRRGLDALRSPCVPPPKFGAVVDPCGLARVSVTLKPGEKRVVRFSLAVAEKSSDAVEAAERTLRLQAPRGVSKLDGAAYVLELGKSEISKAFDLLSELIFITRNRAENAKRVEALVGSADGGSRYPEGQKGLWKFGISGDIPIVTLRAGGDNFEELLSRLVRQHKFLLVSGMQFDLVILTRDGSDYRRPQRSAIRDILKSAGSETLLGVRGGVHIADLSGRDPADEALLCRAASFFLDLEADDPPHPERRRIPRTFHFAAPLPVCDRPSVSGGFTESGAYRIETRGSLPPVAWSHVLANSQFGYLATDAGTGHMWRLNARENKLTDWINDPLAVRGPETLELNIPGKSPVSLFASNDGLDCDIEYGLGYACWSKRGEDFSAKLTAFVPEGFAARVFLVEAECASAPKLRYRAELLLGPDDQKSMHIVSFEENGAICAGNPYNTDFAPQRAVFLSSPEKSSFTCDLHAFCEERFGSETGAGLLPCIAANISMERHDGKFRAVLVTGWAGSKKGVEAIEPLLRWDVAESALEKTMRFWESKCRAVTVKTPMPETDAFLNGWALYQTAACRVLARTALYQSGGAYGFRDQLQDVCALAAHWPELARAQIIRAAAHQFEEGDVQHWWHVGGRGPGDGDRGVRTRMTDDLLWLPYALCEYIEQTGDRSVADIRVPFLRSRPLEEGEHERYERPQISESSDSVLGHAIRSIDLVLSRGMGAHGLCLIGGGDWNDGMDRVGAGGRGESIWLTWFLIHVLERFAELCEALGQHGRAERYRSEAKRCADAANEAWDGDWFLRGYYDDGSTLGSKNDDECKIDSIAQSFSAVTGLSDPDKRDRALKSAREALSVPERRYVKLFTPAFERTKRNPGYIKGYLPGVRENGAQYTHASVWLAMGHLLSGMPDEGAELLRILAPSGGEPEKYLVEPYVIAADIYSNPAHEGRGGWSWYTGAAAWYYRVTLQNFLGLRKTGDRLHIRPNIPPSWEGFEAEWRHGASLYHISVRRGAGALTLDGVPIDGGCIPLLDDGSEHSVTAYI